MSNVVLAPLTDDELDADQRALIAPYAERDRDYAMFRTMLHNQPAMAPFGSWGGYILSRANSLTSRQREIVIHEKRAKNVPIGRMGSGADTAFAALFRASDEAGFITGAILPVDGGSSIKLAVG
ncbi:SDR family oxidoreductase [Sphingomonas sp.]|uniref:SDR family oxidoreductase n=1 Tax=Sphingomonas sp. TaxID=28214 RepID=UPI001ED0F7A3|nr:SDR family oxidoreductase [Sphingomonas sp.]MBX3595060.1 SDR family oxidoreductase [Sphingomonas sp.]